MASKANCVFGDSEAVEEEAPEFLDEEGGLVNSPSVTLNWCDYPDEALEDKASEDKASEDKASEDKASEDKASEEGPKFLDDDGALVNIPSVTMNLSDDYPDEASKDEVSEDSDERIEAFLETLSDDENYEKDKAFLKNARYNRIIAIREEQRDSHTPSNTKCREWEATGKCSFGNRCHYLHEVSTQTSTQTPNRPVANRVLPRKSRICVHFLKGRCHHMDDRAKCCFAHGDSDLVWGQ